MGLSTVRTLLPRTKTYPSHYFKIQQKNRVFPGTQENLQTDFHYKWKFDHFFALRKQRFPIRFSRVSGHLWCLLYIQTYDSFKRIVSLREWLLGFRQSKKREKRSVWKGGTHTFLFSPFFPRANSLWIRSRKK
jgi:hypothetical protein